MDEEDEEEEALPLEMVRRAPFSPLPADPRARYDGIITSIKAFVRLRHYGQSID